MQLFSYLFEVCRKLLKVGNCYLYFCKPVQQIADNVSSCRKKDQQNSRNIMAVIRVSKKLETITCSGN